MQLEKNYLIKLCHLRKCRFITENTPSTQNYHYWIYYLSIKLPMLLAMFFFFLVLTLLYSLIIILTFSIITYMLQYAFCISFMLVGLRYKLNASFKLLRYCFQNVIVYYSIYFCIFLKCTLWTRKFPIPMSSRDLFLFVLLSCTILLPLNIMLENYYQNAINFG